MAEQTTESDLDTKSTGGKDTPTLAEQLQAAISERDQFKDKWARAMADLDNFRKRIYREMDDERKYQSAPMLKSMLPIFDGLDRAVSAAAKSKNFDDLLNGVQMTIKQIETGLARPWRPNQLWLKANRSIRICTKRSARLRLPIIRQ